MRDYAALKQMDFQEQLKNRTILYRISLPTRFVSIVDAGARVVSSIAVIESG